MLWTEKGRTRKGNENTRAILNGVVRTPPWEGEFWAEIRRTRRIRLRDVWGKSIPVRRNSQCESPEAEDRPRCVWWQPGRLCGRSRACAELSKRGAEKYMMKWETIGAGCWLLWGFICHWREFCPLMRGVTWSDLYFERITPSTVLRIDGSKSQGSLNVCISEACGYKLSTPVIILSTFFK